MCDHTTAVPPCALFCLSESAGTNGVTSNAEFLRQLEAGDLASNTPEPEAMRSSAGTPLSLENFVQESDCTVCVARGRLRFFDFPIQCGIDCSPAPTCLQTRYGRTLRMPSAFYFEEYLSRYNLFFSLRGTMAEGLGLMFLNSTLFSTSCSLSSTTKGGRPETFPAPSGKAPTISLRLPETRYDVGQRHLDSDSGGVRGIPSCFKEKTKVGSAIVEIT